MKNNPGNSSGSTEMKSQEPAEAKQVGRQGSESARNRAKITEIQGSGSTTEAVNPNGKPIFEILAVTRSISRELNQEKSKEKKDPSKIIKNSRNKARGQNRRRKKYVNERGQKQEGAQNTQGSSRINKSSEKSSQLVFLSQSPSSKKITKTFGSLMRSQIFKRGGLMVKECGLKGSLKRGHGGAGKEVKEKRGGGKKAVSPDPCPKLPHKSSQDEETNSRLFQSAIMDKSIDKSSLIQRLKSKKSKAGFVRMKKNQNDSILRKGLGDIGIDFRAKLSKNTENLKRRVAHNNRIEESSIYEMGHIEGLDEAHNNVKSSFVLSKQGSRQAEERYQLTRTLKHLIKDQSKSNLTILKSEKSGFSKQHHIDQTYGQNDPNDSDQPFLSQSHAKNTSSHLKNVFRKTTNHRTLDKDELEHNTNLIEFLNSRSFDGHHKHHQGTKFSELNSRGPENNKNSTFDIQGEHFDRERACLGGSDNRRTNRLMTYDQPGSGAADIEKKTTCVYNQENHQVGLSNRVLKRVESSREALENSRAKEGSLGNSRIELTSLRVTGGGAFSNKRAGSEAKEKPLSLSPSFNTNSRQHPLFHVEKHSTSKKRLLLKSKGSQNRLGLQNRNKATSKMVLMSKEDFKNRTAKGLPLKQHIRSKNSFGAPAKRKSKTKEKVFKEQQQAAGALNFQNNIANRQSEQPQHPARLINSEEEQDSPDKNNARQPRATTKNEEEKLKPRLSFNAAKMKINDLRKHRSNYQSSKCFDIKSKRYPLSPYFDKKSVFRSNKQSTSMMMKSREASLKNIYLTQKLVTELSKENKGRSWLLGTNEGFEKGREAREKQSKAFKDFFKTKTKESSVSKKEGALAGNGSLMVNLNKSRAHLFKGGVSNDLNKTRKQSQNEKNKKMKMLNFEDFPEKMNMRTARKNSFNSLLLNNPEKGRGKKLELTNDFRLLANKKEAKKFATATISNKNLFRMNFDKIENMASQSPDMNDNSDYKKARRRMTYKSDIRGRVSWKGGHFADFRAKGSNSKEVLPEAEINHKKKGSTEQGTGLPRMKTCTNLNLKLNFYGMSRECSPQEQDSVLHKVRSFRQTSITKVKEEPVVKMSRAKLLKTFCEDEEDNDEEQAGVIKSEDGDPIEVPRLGLKRVKTPMVESAKRRDMDHDGFRSGLYQHLEQRRQSDLDQLKVPVGSAASSQHSGIIKRSFDQQVSSLAERERSFMQNGDIYTNRNRLRSNSPYVLGSFAKKTIKRILENSKKRVLLLDDESYKLQELNSRLIKLFSKLDVLKRGYITKSQIQHNFPKSTKNDLDLKQKILSSFSTNPSTTYIDLVGFLRLVHFLISIGAYSG